ncbi:hypothetical protein LSTR_LSTR010934 [Laodelphax striatellus]|uniref:Ig-like domain-containing protein n=1 Tax=Laodelphax striatellus TaxID=195883 RepID=A0A482WZI5_LAOST|nr:hypothetical protein LSTR_LSTR010934 [Laodelphax striatellus]
MKAPTFSSESRSSTFLKVKGQSFSLLCQAQAFPVPLFRWYKFLDGSSRKQAVVMDERVKQVSGTLIIREARVEDSGKYLCVVNNSVGGESVETVLTVTAPLAAGVEPTTQTVDFGRPAIFKCNYEGNPVKTVSWLKDGKALPGHEEPVLKIESVRKEDKGMYQCFVRNEQESAQASAELKLGGRFEPPQIRHSFNEETMQPGPSVFLKCVASGNPTPEITWELDARKLSNSDRLQVGQYVTMNGDVVSHLNISSVQTNDGGLYKCIASSKVGSAEHAARLNVYGLPFVRPIDKKMIVAGETLFVTCPVAGYPIESIVWERDGRLLPINRKQKVFPNGTLIIENVERMSDQATYTCVAKNSQGFSSRGTLEVQVLVRPHITPFSFEGDANSGEGAQLTCYVGKGDTPLLISWSVGDLELTSSSAGVIMTKIGERTSLLTLTNVTAASAGNYTCTAVNRGGTANHTAMLSVNVMPYITPFFQEEAATNGDSIQLNCHVAKGDRPLKITWSFHGEELSSHLGISTAKFSERSSILTIASAMAAHTGNYTCSASNQAGTASFTATVLVNVRPTINPFYLESQTFAGETIQLNCFVARGDSPLLIGWNVNGQSLSISGSGVSVTQVGPRTSLLTIGSVMDRHSGNYTCYAENKAGRAEHSVTLLGLLSHYRVAERLAPGVIPLTPRLPLILQKFRFSFGDEPLEADSSAVRQCGISRDRAHQSSAGGLTDFLGPKLQR